MDFFQICEKWRKEYASDPDNLVAATGVCMANYIQFFENAIAFDEAANVEIAKQTIDIMDRLADTDLDDETLANLYHSLHSIVGIMSYYPYPHLAMQGWTILNKIEVRLNNSTIINVNENQRLQNCFEVAKQFTVYLIQNMIAYEGGKPEECMIDGFGYAHDPIVWSSKFESANYEASKKAYRELSGCPKDASFADMYWNVKQHILKNEYGIEWSKPTENEKFDLAKWMNFLEQQKNATLVMKTAFEKHFCNESEENADDSEDADYNNDEKVRKLQDEQRRLKDERRRLEEEKRRQEEEKRILEEERRRQEEERRRQEEERRRQEEERRRQEEEKRRIEDEKRRQEEEKKKHADIATKIISFLIVLIVPAAIWYFCIRDKKVMETVEPAQTVATDTVKTTPTEATDKEPDSASNEPTKPIENTATKDTTKAVGKQDDIKGAGNNDDGVKKPTQKPKPKPSDDTKSVEKTSKPTKSLGRYTLRSKYKKLNVAVVKPGGYEMDVLRKGETFDVIEMVSSDVYKISYKGGTVNIAKKYIEPANNKRR